MAAADLYWMHDPIYAIKKINTKENLEENCKKKFKTTEFKKKMLMCKISVVNYKIK